MDVRAALGHIEAAVTDQLMLTASDPAVEEAAETFLRVLRPAIDAAAMTLAEQAAAEVAAQLPSHEVRVVLSEGEPVIEIMPQEDPVVVPSSDLEARLTVRLPEQLKSVIEQAASDAGDSINSYVVKSLAKRSTSHSTGRRFSGTIET